MYLKHKLAVFAVIALHFCAFDINTLRKDNELHNQHGIEVRQMDINELKKLDAQVDWSDIHSNHNDEADMVNLIQIESID